MTELNIELVSNRNYDENIAALQNIITDVREIVQKSTAHMYERMRSSQSRRKGTRTDSEHMETKSK